MRRTNLMPLLLAGAAHFAIDGISGKMLKIKTKPYSNYVISNVINLYKAQ